MQEKDNRATIILALIAFAIFMVGAIVGMLVKEPVVGLFSGGLSVYESSEKPGTYGVTLTNPDPQPTKMKYAITSDSETVTAIPPEYVTDTVSPGDSRKGEFVVNINNTAGRYTLVVHGYTQKNSVWTEFDNRSITIEKS